VLKQVQPVIQFAAAHLDEDVSLAALAEQAGLSAFHLHRVFAATAGETPKQFTQRLRLTRAAAMLATTKDSVLDIALACGFQSHEVFSRSFRKRFGISPSAYRDRGIAANDPTQAARHASIVHDASPCIGLFHSHEKIQSEETVAYTISKKEVAPQPVLVIQRRVKQPEISAALGEILGNVFQQALQNGFALAGAPFARYLEWGPGLVTMEGGVQVQAHIPSAPLGDQIRAETLPGGPVATTVHAGPYDKLTEAHAAVQQWIETEGLTMNGAPWEVYVTDPGQYPDPKDWKTEVYWPVRA
jgi:AraC family transcriptional regulator